MSDPNHAGGHEAAGARTLTLGTRTVTVERPNGYKATRAIAGVRALSKAFPELQGDLARFRQAYEADNVVALDRVQAKLRFPPRPILDEDGAVRLDEDGTPLLLPSPVDRLTEEDWTEAGGLYRMPSTPSTEEMVMAVLDRALEVAEEHVYRFLALFTVSNDDLRRYRRDGTLEERLDEAAADLLDDAYADEVMELAVVIAETVDHHFRRKASDLGDRLGKTLATFGLGRPSRQSPAPAPAAATSSDGPSASTPTSSTDSPAPTPDGPPTPSSGSPTTSSSPSASASTRTRNGEPSPNTTPALEEAAA